MTAKDLMAFIKRIYVLKDGKLILRKDLEKSKQKTLA